MTSSTRRDLVLGGTALAAALAMPTLARAQATDVAIIGFQMSSETHARAANAAAAAALAKGWTPRRSSSAPRRLACRW
jgi:simple sugar transport system substrate-binding protein/ribose transport system substrate-binding protein